MLQKNLQNELEDLKNTDGLTDIEALTGMVAKYSTLYNESKTRILTEQLATEKAIDKMNDAFLRECYARDMFKKAVKVCKKLIKKDRQIIKECISSKKRKSALKHNKHMIKYLWRLKNE